MGICVIGGLVFTCIVVCMYVDMYVYIYIYFCGGLFGFFG